MCLQCSADAVKIKGDILPGFSLYQAQTDTKEWPKGWYGLVEGNDPTVVFKGPLLTDSTAGMSDEVLDAMAEFPAGYEEYTEAADQLGERLVLDAYDGYRLVSACIQVGFRPNDHGFIHYWLMDFMAQRVAAPA